MGPPSGHLFTAHGPTSCGHFLTNTHVNIAILVVQNGGHLLATRRPPLVGHSVRTNQLGLNNTPATGHKEQLKLGLHGLSGPILWACLERPLRALKTFSFFQIISWFRCYVDVMCASYRPKGPSCKAALKD